ncbi:MAG TPA: serine protease [Geminicoccaceae bacterium]|nr:serine protease [Geminicoccaceae bacterium]
MTERGTTTGTRPLAREPAHPAGNVIQRVFGRHMEGAHCRLGLGEVDDPGPRLRPGTDRCVGLDEVATCDRILAPPDILPAHFVEAAAWVQKAVARVVLTEPHAGLPAGGGWGTGFLVSNSVLLTNHHVVPTAAFARRVRVEFNYQLDAGGLPRDVDAFEPDPASFFHANPALDFTLMRLRPKLVRRAADPARDVGAGRREAFRRLLDGRRAAAEAGGPDLRPITLILRYPGMDWGFIPLDDGVAFAEGQHLNLVQHPRGRRKEIALGDNRIDGVYADHIRYDTDAEPGASGSPVLDDHWRLLALHQAAGERDPVTGTWAGNQAVRADRIVADLRTRFAGAPLLGELGL